MKVNVCPYFKNFYSFSNKQQPMFFSRYKNQNTIEIKCQGTSKLDWNSQPMLKKNLLETSFSAG